MSSKIRRRRTLRQSDVRELHKEASAFVDPDRAKLIEVAELEDGAQLYFINGVGQLVRSGDILHPTLKCDCLDRLPSIIVDMGAVRFICNGADLMAPGIVAITGDFLRDSLVVIRDERHKKALAVGKALLSSDEIKMTKKGKVAQNLHYVGDHLWRAYS